MHEARHGKDAMTLNDLQRAHLAVFAARQAGPGASLEEMKAICYCIRNRVSAGWYPDWISVIEYAHETAAHETTPFALDINSRPLQRLMRDVDDIYYGRSTMQDSYDGETEGNLESALCTDTFQCKYWCYLNRPVLPWFAEKIAGDKTNHPMRSQMGLMMFFE
jgi:hypothetical protein